MTIALEMNLDQTVISREGYTVLDLLSDIGGIQGVVGSALVVLISILNYNHFDDYLVT